MFKEGRSDASQSHNQNRRGGKSRHDFGWKVSKVLVTDPTEEEVSPQYLQKALFFFFFVFYLFRAAPMAFGGLQARGPIGAVAADIHHSHSNAGFKPRL